MQTKTAHTRTKCYECFRPSSACLCKHTNPIQTKTRFIILMHPKEYKREKIGTGRMTKLQLENSEIIVGIDFTHNKRVNEILNNKKNSPFLLYPGKDNFNLSVRKSAEIISLMGHQPHIFLLDGTWSCARKNAQIEYKLAATKESEL